LASVQFLTEAENSF